MPYLIVKGSFHLYYKKKRHVGSQPDGDSIWFKPDNAARLKELDGRSAKFNPGGFAQLRFEGIDALELHFEGKHQKLELASHARDFLLDELGFKKVEFSKNNLSVSSATPHLIKGYILTRSIDPFGRPVSFVFTGDLTSKDGESIFLDTKMFDRSMNSKLTKAGNAFPSFYTGLPTDLRNRIIDQTKSAQAGKKGIWPYDRTTKGAACEDVESLQKAVLFPKLFRRLVSYFAEKKQGLKGFEKWLRQDSKRDDEVWIASRAEKGNMHDVIKIVKGKISLKYTPEDIIIVPR